ncbi:MAG: sodium:calcium antiporter [Candidatus Micrarchaeota archaeon]|nr:sodium:calcium antiporter [Candidatus Micrarchaeota archaeon]MDE1824493.1 sodium:calcium antiporter [Candidatus Micrarchaeota archaeon]MDE1849125.1 sodium:calcium antiporter [Candidatus Micrarchaeota archaeon]
MALASLVTEIIIVIAGFGIAAELVARATGKLEPLLDQGMTGGVILGLLGALPETMFVIIAMLHGSNDIALGSALGGNVILFTLGIGVVGIVYMMKWKKPVLMKEDYHVESIFLMIATIAMVALLFYGKLGRLSGTLMILIYAVYIGYRYYKSRAMIERNTSSQAAQRTILEGAALLAAGTIIVLLLSETFVHLLTDLSGVLSVPPIWLALVISPLAAELEENLGAYRIATKTHGGGSTAIVSFVGGKLQNNTMLLGIIGLLSASPVALNGALSAFVAVIAINVIALWAINRGRISFMNGMLFVLLYFVTIAATFYL